VVAEQLARVAGNWFLAASAGNNSSTFAIFYAAGVKGRLLGESNPCFRRESHEYSTLIIGGGCRDDVTQGKEDTSYPVQVGTDVVDTLRPVLDGRKPDEPLLCRWRMKQTRQLTGCGITSSDEATSHCGSQLSHGFGTDFGSGRGKSYTVA
jgi:hypothetical protein